MTDLEYVELAKKLNWKPGIQYWKEQYDAAVEKLQYEQKETDRLRALVIELGGNPNKPRNV